MEKILDFIDEGNIPDIMNFRNDNDNKEEK